MNNLNDFKIGMFGPSTKTHFVNGCEVPFETPLHNGNNTSVFNVLSNDGFNIIQSYTNEWTTESHLKSLIKLSQANNLKIELGVKDFYKPTVDFNSNYLGFGTNVYDNCGNSISTCQSPFIQNYFRPNYQSFINNIFKITPYNETIWGYHICEEASYYHYHHFSNNCQGNVWQNPNYFIYVETPPSNVADAISYFKNSLSSVGITNHKMIVMEANHQKSITSSTDDGQGSYNPQNYIQLLNKNDKRDIFFEGSYNQFPVIDWNNWQYSNITNSGPINNYHYLGAFKSIEYASGFTSEVHKVIGIEGTIGGGNYLTHFHSDLNIQNANWLWFQAYTSIIHGAKGIWFWDLNYSWNIDETNNWNNTLIQNRYDRSYFPINYQSYVAFLSRELRYLVDKNLISTDESSILYTKTDHFDENCIVPSADTYIPITYDNLPLWVEHINENYGLRYTIRTNGEEVIMIVSNPLNIPVTVPLNFEGLGNEIISNSYGVDVLFDTGTNSVSSSNYKVDRDSDIDLVNGLVGDSYYMPFNNGKNLSIDFGPMDVKILKFRSNAPIVNTDGWDKEWSNYGNGKIDGWSISDSDKFIKGDFDGDGEDELLCVQLNLSNNWASLLGYENGDWSWDWSNYGNNTIGDWTIRETDKFYVSDFDSDGKEELLIVQQDDDILNWASLYSYNNGVWIRDWSNLGNNTIGGWSIKELDRFVVGDYDDDDKGDLLCIQAENNFGNWSALLDFENGVWNWKWSNYGNNMIGTWGIRVKDSFFAGKYKILLFGKLTDFSDKLVCIQGDGGWAKTLRFFNGNWVEQYNNYSSGLIGGWGVPLQSTDKVLSANFDNDLIDELIFIQTGSSNPGWAASQSLNPNLSDWNWNWSVSPNTLSYINDWPIADLGIGNTKYMSLKPDLNKPEMILAIRDFGCDGNERFLASLYSSQVNVNKSINNVNHSVDIQPNVMIVYPNPSSGEITIKLKNEELLNGEIVIYDAKGSKIYNQKVNKKRNVSLNLNEQNNGLYYVHYFNEFISTTVKFQIVK